MNLQKRSQLALGLILVLLGGWFIAQRSIPELAVISELFTDWTITVIGVGVLLLFLGVILGAPGLAIPAAMVSGIGAILYYQNQTENWESWTFMWTLVIGFVGLGVILQGLLGGGFKHKLIRGLNLMVTSAVMFLVFSAIFSAWNVFGNFVPNILLILLGLWVLGRAVFNSMPKKSVVPKTEIEEKS
ncbi:MAG: hypothetical protein QGD96_10650 [Anaerolineae bacterium]|nr:hypothetical protein [Anaerolineae bacterium]